MYEQFEKAGKRGKPPGYRQTPRPVKSVETEFHDSQLKFAKNEDAERMDQYAKPGTSAAARAGDPFSYTYPTSRYRSRRP